MDGVPELLTGRVWGGRPRLSFLFLYGQLGGLIRYDRLETLHWLHAACRAKTSRV